jgi:hypothetical protein
MEWACNRAKIPCIVNLTGILFPSRPRGNGDRIRSLPTKLRTSAPHLQRRDVNMSDMRVAPTSRMTACQCPGSLFHLPVRSSSVRVSGKLQVLPGFLPSVPSVTAELASRAARVFPSNLPNSASQRAPPRAHPHLACFPNSVIIRGVISKRVEWLEHGPPQ